MSSRPGARELLDIVLDRARPAALRTARRGMRLAAEVRLPLVSVIDTPGEALSTEAKEGGPAEVSAIMDGGDPSRGAALAADVGSLTEVSTADRLARRSWRYAFLPESR